MKVVIVDSGGSNIASIIVALNKLGLNAQLSVNKEQIAAADKVILPGVGSAENSRQWLEQHNLITFLPQLTQPLLGFCLGMQILFAKSEEGQVDCLNIIPQPIIKLRPHKGFAVPHMGWNQVTIVQPDPLLKKIPDNSFFFFAHSYYAQLGPYTIAYSEHHQQISAIVKKDNFYGCQFHPEKSGHCGHQLLKNFMDL